MRKAGQDVEQVHGTLNCFSLQDIQVLEEEGMKSDKRLVDMNAELEFISLSVDNMIAKTSVGTSDPDCIMTKIVFSEVRNQQLSVG